MEIEVALAADVCLPGSWLSGAAQLRALPTSSSASSSSSSISVSWIAVQCFGVVSADPSWLSLGEQESSAADSGNNKAASAKGGKSDKEGSNIGTGSVKGVPPPPARKSGGLASRFARATSSSILASSSGGPPQVAAVVVPPGVASPSPGVSYSSSGGGYSNGMTEGGRHIGTAASPTSEDSDSNGLNHHNNSHQPHHHHQHQHRFPAAIDPQTIAAVARYGDVSQKMLVDWESRLGRNYWSQQQYIMASPAVLLGYNIAIAKPPPRGVANDVRLRTKGGIMGEAGEAADRPAAQSSYDSSLSTASVEFALRLPYTLPPTFSGCGLRYRYFICVSVGLPPAVAGGEPDVKVFTVPFRVVNPTSSVRRIVYRPMFPDNFDFAVRGRFINPAWRQGNLSGTPDDSPGVDKEPPSRPVHARSRHRRQSSEYQEMQQEHDMVQSLATVKQVIDRHAHPVTAAIRRGRSSENGAASTELVATVCLTRTSFKLGDSVQGAIHFPSGIGGHFANSSQGDSSLLDAAGRAVIVAARCYQVTVRLQVEETLDKKFASARRGFKPHVTTIAEQHELVESAAFIPFDLPIPAEATPEMTTELVSVRWLLHFEFMTSPPILSDDAIVKAVAGSEKVGPDAQKSDSNSESTSPGTSRVGASERAKSDQALVVKPSRPRVGRPDVEPLHWSLPLRVFIAELPPQPIVPRRYTWEV